MIGECDCQDGLTGSNCDQKTCPGKPPCTSPEQGQCNDIPSNPKCKCFEAWKGESCSEKTCPGKDSGGYANPCSGHGTCGDYNLCNCTNAYKGDDCSEDPANPTTEVPTSSTKPTTESLSECTNDCFNNGKCNKTEGKCVCKPNYDSKPDCSGMMHVLSYIFAEVCCTFYHIINTFFAIVFACASNTSCLNNGLCSSSVCYCFEAWTGETCSEKTCLGKNSSGYSNPCSGHGTCKDDNKCSCTDAYKGDDCSEDKPNSTTELPPTPNIKPLTNFQNGLQCNTRLLNLSILVFLIPAYV